MIYYKVLEISLQTNLGLATIYFPDSALFSSTV